MRTETDSSNAVEPRTKWSGIRIAMAAFVAVIVLGTGAVFLVQDGVGLFGSGTSEDATLVFDGTSCTYSGPITLQLGSSLNVTYTNLTEVEANLSWWKVAEGTTAADIAEIDITTFPRPPGFAHGQLEALKAPAGSEATTLLDMKQVGQHMLSCFVRPEIATEAIPYEPYPTFIHVVDE